MRRSDESDLTAINAIHTSAFGATQGHEIAELVEGLLGDATAEPLLSLVAETDGMLVGHVLFSAVKIASNLEVSARILAPLAVSADYQGAGVGSALVREGLQQLAESGVDLVFVLGHPSYYPRFGFRPAGVLGLEAPYPIPSEHADAWMVLQLVTGNIGKIKGRVLCSETLSQPQHWTE